MQNRKDERIRREVDSLGIPSNEMLKKEIKRMDKKERYRKLIKGIISGLIIATAIILIITNVWLAVIQIDGTSMTPLLQMDEIVVATRTDNATPNDIIAFTQKNKLYVKRVIAVAGDRIEINNDGYVTVNGEMLDEPYVEEQSFGKTNIEFPYQVPTGTVFVMGDNRVSSVDSRDREFGPVSREQIVGKLVLKVWPLSKMGKM